MPIENTQVPGPSSPGGGVLRRWRKHLAEAAFLERLRRGFVSLQLVYWERKVRQRQTSRQQRPWYVGAAARETRKKMLWVTWSLTE